MPRDGSPPGPAGTAEEFRAAWVAALDQLEVDVATAEQMLASNEPEPMPAWEPPHVVGNLPADLVPRARLVLERQLSVAHRLTERLASNTQQQRLTRAVRATGTPDVPVYLDVTA